MVTVVKESYQLEELRMKQEKEEEKEEEKEQRNGRYPSSTLQSGVYELCLCRKEEANQKRRTSHMRVLACLRRSGWYLPTRVQCIQNSGYSIVVSSIVGVV